jgi:p-cumate 2,3-dioxygenase beta subunit
VTTPGRADVEDFLYQEAALLDAWQLEEWLGLWIGDGRYLVPAPDAPDGDPDATLALVADDRVLRQERVRQLLAGTTWAEVPRSRLRRLVTNVRIVERRADRLRVASSFLLQRSRPERTDVLVGGYQHELRLAAGALRIAEKRVLLAHANLHAHGGLALIL